MPPTLGGAIGDLSDDTYVAQLLAREARDSSLKYSAHGLEAYAPKRPTSGAPKPNTRFLRNIIRETDNHNAALKRKEEREARERMRQLRGGSSKSAPVLSDERESKRRSGEQDRSHRHRSHRRRHRSRSVSSERERDRSRRRRRRHAEDGEGDYRRLSTRDGRDRSRRERSYSRSRSRSPRREQSPGRRSRHRRHKRPSRRSRSPSRSRSRSPEMSGRRRYKEEEDRASGRRKDGDGQASTRRHATEASPPPTTLQDYASEDEESDPLEDLVGPLPPRRNGSDDAPIRSRGRGAYKSKLSNIDAHFAPDYDPITDVDLEDNDAATAARTTRRPVAGLMTGDDDWELALEALRDRARWKQKGEERLREAGFNESIVERWKSNTAFPGTGDAEGRLEDVKWSKKGEGREWDRGKVVDEDGHVELKAPW